VEHNYIYQEKVSNLTLHFFFAGIQFQIQRMSANDSADVNVASSPYRHANIGVEKLLEINSEENHDDVCLAYVFTYRDFADGVLGLAWVGEAGTQTAILRFALQTAC